MEEKLWVITKPTPDSILEDILFETTAKGLVLQFKGGLKGDDIVFMTDDKKEATKIANDLLSKINKGVVSNMDEKILKLIEAGKTDKEIIEIMGEEKSPKEVQEKINKMGLMKNTPKTSKSTYKVSMTETRASLYEIEANSADEAVAKCKEKYFEGTLGEPINEETTDRFFQSEN